MFLIVCGYLLYADAPMKTEDQSGLFRFISWNEFYYELLSKGEVTIFVLLNVDKGR